MKNNKWWSVENLRKSEEKIKNNNDSQINSGDFYSYRKILEGESIKNSNLESHNDLKSKNKLIFIDKLISHNKDDNNLQILDVGCGAGFATNEISKLYNNSNITGIDISIDAITFAKKNFNNIEFICQGVEPDNPLLGSYDIIFCFEFYPFTRTKSFITHKEYLNYFLSQLKTNGVLILHQLWQTESSIYSNFDHIKEELNNYKIEKYVVPRSKIISIFGPNLISVFVDKILRYILRKKPNAVLIFKKIQTS